MADLEGLKVSKDYHVDVPFANQEGFFLRGINSLDWGMKKHMANIFDPHSGNTVMFAFDHGYFMGSTAGLERLDLLLPRLAPYCMSSNAPTMPSMGYCSTPQRCRRASICGSKAAASAVSRAQWGTTSKPSFSRKAKAAL